MCERINKAEWILYEQTAIITVSRRQATEGTTGSQKISEKWRTI